MAKFKKKPVVIEASQWFKNGDHPKVSAVPKGMGILVNAAGSQTTCKHCGNHVENHGFIETLEGGHIVCWSDWIIKGIKGEFYPCKPDIFEAIYEPAE